MDEVGWSSSVLTPRDLDMLAKGREFEREDIIRALKKSSQENMKRNVEHSLQVGFMVELIKELETGQ